MAQALDIASSKYRSPAGPGGHPLSSRHCRRCSGDMGGRSPASVASRSAAPLPTSAGEGPPVAPGDPLGPEPPPPDVPAAPLASPPSDPAAPATAAPAASAAAPRADP